MGSARRFWLKGFSWSCRQTLAGVGVISKASSVTGLMPGLGRFKWLGAARVRVSV